MMLLPSGRSNSDVYPLQNSTTTATTGAAAAAANSATTNGSITKPLLLTRTSSPQLTSINSGITTTENVAIAYTTTTAAATLSPTTAAAAAAGNHSANGSNATDRISVSTTVNSTVSQTTATSTTTATATTQQPLAGHYPPLLGSAVAHAAAVSVLGQAGNWQEIDRHLENVQSKLKEGWTVHVGKEGRLYYCNHLTQASGWLPSCEDWSRNEELLYGWERAIDSKGRTYYINHLNKTSTYEAPECVRWDEQTQPEPRLVVLQRSANLGFGFVAGSERPVIVRFVTEGGPSINKLLPGDLILAVNGEDVKEAPRDHVIQLVRACETQVSLLVCQPALTLVPGRKSTLLSAGKRAKLKTRPSRVRFAESVCVNGAPLFPPSAFSLGDICVPPMANVLKVFLENGQTKSFKYDATTTVQDVVTSLLDKLCFNSGELVSLVLEHVKSLKRNKLTLLDPEESLARVAARPGAHKLRCLFRVTFVPISAADLAQKDMNALDYLYLQCCNDVTQERFAPELQPEVALRLAALHMHQHALANNFSPAKLTVKVVEREFGLDRFVPVSLFEGMKRKELRRLISHFLKLNAEMTGSSTKVLTQLQAKLHYLDIIASLPSYGAKCFSTNQREGVERVLLVSPRFGLSQISSVRNSVPQPISAIEDFTHVIVTREDDVTCGVAIFMLGERAVKFTMEDRDACEFSLVLAGYYRLLTGNLLTVVREREQYDEDNAPSYLAQHTVLPAMWSYLIPFHNRAHSVNFLMTPPYHPMPQKAILSNNIANAPAQTQQQQQQQHGQLQQQTSLCETNSVQLPYINAAAMDLDIHSVMATELLEEAKDSGMSDSSGGGSNYCERSGPCVDSAFIEAKNAQVLRRVHEMQQMVQSSEQYLNEQGELLASDEYEALQQRRASEQSSFALGKALGVGSTTGVIEFDSDCDSLNSSKVSSTEETTSCAGAPLKHSDSLTLLAESISNDLSGITQGLNSIGGSQNDVAHAPNAANTPKRRPSLSATSSPRPQRKLNGFSQLLSDLQALGNDFSQSESDSESVASPAQSPTTRRPSMLATGAEQQQQQNGVRRKQNLAYRSSFGLHSPDGNNFCTETKDYNLKEYLKQLKEISNVDSGDATAAAVAAKKLSEIYGFEIREDTFIETEDTDLIDLRAIPPPQTPDELDSLSLLNAPPKGFDDSAAFDKFLENVIVAPPTQKATPAKELTPEEIMSFIIPPPPNLEETTTTTTNQATTKLVAADAAAAADEELDKYAEQTECLYSNSVQAKREFFSRSFDTTSHPRLNGNAPKPTNAAASHVIEYATVERKSKFSCCPKSKKDEQQQQLEINDMATTATGVPSLSNLKLPPRTQSLDQAPPARPPKSADLLQRYSPKKQQRATAMIGATIHSPTLYQQQQHLYESKGPREVLPPQLPPRLSPTATMRTQDDNAFTAVAAAATSAAAAAATVSVIPPKKPPLPPAIANRPPPQLLQRNSPYSMSATTTTTISPQTMTTFVNGNVPKARQQQPQQQQIAPPPPQPATPQSPHSTNGYQQQQQLQQTTATTPPPPPISQRPALSLFCSPQMQRKLPTAAGAGTAATTSLSSPNSIPIYATTTGPKNLHYGDPKLIVQNGHIIDGEALLAKTDIAMAGLLVKLDQVAAQCSAAQAAGGGTSIDEDKFQRARNELTEQTLALVTASKFLVAAMSDLTLVTLPEHLTSCLTAIRRITELTQDMTRHTSAPLQTRNIVLKVHDVASSFRELVGVQVGPLGAGQLALQAECLANVLATLLRSLRVFSP